MSSHSIDKDASLEPEAARQPSRTKSVELVPEGRDKSADAAVVTVEAALLSTKRTEGTKTSDVADATKQLLSSVDRDVADGYYYDYGQSYRWLILVFFVVLAIVAGPAFFNWPPLKEILYSEDAYGYLCPSGAKPEEVGEARCPAQKEAVASILSAAMATMFSLDLIAGILLDCFGGKVTCLFGMVFQVFGWVVLAFSGPKFNGYMAGLLLCAAGADPLFFGLLSVANLFPGWESTIVAVLGAARSISYINFMIVGAMMKSPSISLMGVSLGIAVILVVSAVLTFFFVPYQSFPRVSGATQLPTGEKDKETKVAYSEFLNQRPSSDLRALRTKLGTQFRSVMKHALTWQYALFCLLPLFALTRNNYYCTSYKEHLPNLIQPYKIMNPLSFIPCPLVGVFADKVSTALTIVGMAVCGAISMAVVVTPGTIFEGGLVLQVVSLLFNYIFISFCVSQFYCYIAYVYPQEEMGKLIGIALLIGGCGSAMASPMYNFSTRGTFLAMDLTTVAFEVLVIGICVLLYFNMEIPVKRKLAAALAETKPDVEVAKEEQTETA